MGPLAKVLGWVMDKIYIFLSNTFGIENIALSIIIFTIFIYLCMLPITYQQQKFSNLSRKMQPELQAIQKKYGGKRDQETMMAQQEETQALYDKYGISPTGSCVTSLIQILFLWPLFRVFNNVPAYISSVKNIFTDLVSGIMGVDGFQDKMQTILDNASLRNVQVDFTETDKTALGDYIVDVVYKLSNNGWAELSDAFPTLTDVITSTHEKLDAVNYLFILNISDTPWNLIKSGFSSHAYGLAFAALLIPLISYGTQMLNIKLMPTNTGGNDQMAQQMKTMNLMMPLMSLFICFTLPVGLGLYWIVGAVVRIVQQLAFNRHFEKIDLNDIIEKNKEKAAKKKEKRGERQAQIYNAATMNTKNRSMASKATISTDKEAEIERKNELRGQAKKGSLSAKANMVKDYNENAKK